MGDKKMLKKKAQTKLPKINECTKEYYPIAKCSGAFQQIYEKYKAKKRQNVILPNILTLLADYRTEKLNQLTDGEIIKQEIGGEVKKLNDEIGLPRKSVKTGGEKAKKVKESRLSFLVTLNKFEKQGKFDALKKYFSIKKSMDEEKKFNLNFLYKGKLFNQGSKKRRKETASSITSIQTEDLSVHDRISLLAKEIEEDSRFLKARYINNFNNFQNEFNDYKKVQEFINPEIKQKKEEDN